MKTLRIKIEGTTPLMMNNPQCVNPMNELTKKIKAYTSKRVKTDEDLCELYRLKFLASLYYRNGMYYLPYIHLWQSMIEAAKENKKGKKFERSVKVVDDLKIMFADADKTPEQLWKLERYTDIRDAGIQKSRIICIRSIFPEWSSEAEIWYDESQLDKSDILKALDIAGERYGIGTFRKLYGRFKIKEI